MKLRAGDIFLSAVPGFIGNSINAVQRFHDKTSHSKYSHAGLIINSGGDTLECQTTVVNWNLFSHYAGVPVLVARNECMNPRSFEIGYSAIKERLGESYPWYRIAMHLCPPVAKLSDDKLVCSELVAKFLNRIELFPYFNGCNPDDLHDEICRGYHWDIVFEGVVA